MTAAADPISGPFVVDASIALSWCFEDETTASTDAILGLLERTRGIAPPIWPLEVANALRSAERRGRIDEESLPKVTTLLAGLPIDLDEALPLADATGRLLPLARTLGLSVYDASYIDLAVRRGLALASADDQLMRAAVAAGVTLVEAT